jgi:hypothetical protein
MILRRIKAGSVAFVIGGHGASEQLDRFAWMAVVRTAFVAHLRSGRGSASRLDSSRFPATTAGEPSGPYGCRRTTAVNGQFVHRKGWNKR